MIDILSQTSDPQLSGSWVLELVLKIFVGLGVLFGAVWAAYKKGQGTPVTETILRSPMPEVSTRQSPIYIERNEFDDLKEDIDKKFDQLFAVMAEERRVARETEGKLHARADKTSEAISELKGEVSQISKSVDRLLALAMQSKSTRS